MLEFLGFGKKKVDAPANSVEPEITIAEAQPSSKLMDRLDAVPKGGHTFDSPEAQDVGLALGNTMRIATTNMDVPEAEVTITDRGLANTEKTE